MHDILMLIISFMALIWAANHLVTGASGLALRLNWSPMLMGLTVVALGTSAPEIALSIVSALKNNNDLTVGNLIGSDIANISLVLGLAIIIKPDVLNYDTLKKTYPILIISMLLVYSLILDGVLGKIDGCLFLISALIIIGVFIYLSTHSQHKDHLLNKFRLAGNSRQSLHGNILNIAVGIIVLPVSARFIVHNASVIAQGFGVSETTISLTIVAIGTGLPELITAITAILKNEDGIAIGSIIGANIYNLLLVMAFPALINPEIVSPLIVTRDMPLLIALTFLLFFLSHHYKTRLAQWHGGVLVLIYCCYIAALVIKS